MPSACGSGHPLHGIYELQREAGQKEGAPVSDISAGLAYSVIKNALYKVIKLASPEDLGRHIVVQGGTFHNQAVLRAFEKIAGVEATCPDISGLMGAFGAALIARSHYHGQQSTMLPLEEMLKLNYKTTNVRCGGCSNNCMLTVNTSPADAAISAETAVSEAPAGERKAVGHQSGAV